jgi:uncharacterized protein (TIGR00661 family)
MKILYSVQATGNGHISRAMELIPYLQQYGKLDIFLSGANSNLNFDFPVKYRSRGLSLFYTCKGKLDYVKTALAIAPSRIRKEVRDLPVEKYGLILNDFECITALACAYKKIPSVNFGHQASFASPHTPRPHKRSPLGEWILKNYARATYYAGLHFKEYDHFIFPPVIKKEIREAKPVDNDFILVYLPAYCEIQLEKIFHLLSSYRFQIFSREARIMKQSGNITFLPIDNKLFSIAMVNCTGIITGGGFETSAEALKLGKKLMVIPIKGHYEQECNAAALEQMGVKKIDRADADFFNHFEKWIQSEALKIDYNHSTEDIIANVMKSSIAYINEKRNSPPVLNPDFLYPSRS